MIDLGECVTKTGQARKKQGVKKKD
jgi:hypothetical protein